MSYCVPRGIPHSRFLSWSPDDQDKALAYQRMHRATCSRCGTRPDEWREENGRLKRDQPYAAVVETCPGCAAIDAMWKAETKDTTERPGARPSLIPAAEAERRSEEHRQRERARNLGEEAMPDLTDEEQRAGRRRRSRWG